MAEFSAVSVYAKLFVSVLKDVIS